MAFKRRLENKVAIITGGASGIGLASVMQFLEEGAKVVIADINRATGTEALETFTRQGDGDRVRFFQCDVSLEHDIMRLVQTAVRDFGRLDCMVNCAGTGGAYGPLIDTSVQDWDRTQEILLRSVFLGIKYAALQMIRQGEGGAIVNMSSIAGLCGGAGGAAYSTAKAGVINLTRCAAVQLAPQRIRCNAVLPGTIVTPLLIRNGDPETMRQVAAATQPWPEAGLPEHVAPLVAFLASDESRLVTGEGVTADGGNVAAGMYLYSGHNPLGNAIAERMEQAGVGSFDYGMTRTPAKNADARTTAAVQGPQTILLTGVTRGLGRALLEEFTAQGHTVIGCARSADAVRALAERWPAPHRFDVVDVADDAQVRTWAEQVLSERAAPDYLLNNAAVTHDGRQVWRFSAEEYAHVVGVNLLGVANVLRYFVPAMLRRKKGVIVNFSSGWGREVAPKAGPYAASKWGIEGLTRVLAEELPPTMAAVPLHPGIINTPSLQESFGEHAEAYPKPDEWAKQAVPFILGIGPRDNGHPLEVPGMTKFLGVRNSRVEQN